MHPRSRGFTKAALTLLTLAGLQAEAVEKFSSYRPYPYVFLHGRGAFAHQWGFKPYDEDDVQTYGMIDGTLHENKNSNGKLFKSFFYQMGYAERLYNEFLAQGECGKDYRVSGGVDVGSRPKDVLKSRTERLYTEGAALPPGTCRNYEFYDDFHQLSPDALGPYPLSLPANSLPNKETWGKGDGNKHFTLPEASQWHEMSFNHSFIEAYQGDGEINGIDQEVLSNRWGKTTLVEIARKRIKQVLDEYYGQEIGSVTPPRK
ncbi:MAG: hypothetical protein M3Y08_05245 [Fibrobacterota bacterium]|nr:hypothetical protein [Fibrobacterota bacterium]